MKLPKPSRKVRVSAVALFLVCAGLTGVGIWRVSAYREDGQSFQGRSQESLKGSSQVDSRTLIRRGVGSEVNLAAANATSAEVELSVNSVDRFISSRSNLKMSDETKERLMRVEQAVLNGAGNRINLEDLSDVFTEIVTNRLATMTDEQIEQTANSFATPEGEISPRAKGSWGLLTSDSITKQLQQGREESLSKNSKLREMLHTQITDMIRERVATLSEAVPEQFGNIANDGVTPLQAVLIGYSMVADDPLTGSQSDMAQQMRQQRMTDRRMRSEKREGVVSQIQLRATSRDESGLQTNSLPKGPARAYGIDGELQALPVNLVFNRAGIAGLLDRLEGGERK